MDVFEKKELTPDRLKSVGRLAEKMRKLALGGGQKKEPKVSAVKDSMVKKMVLDMVDTMERTMDHTFEEDVAILAIVELGRRYKKRYDKIAKEDLPSILGEAGLKELVLWTDEKIVIKDELSASITDKNYALVRKNMIAEYRRENKTTEEAAKAVIDEYFKSSIIIKEPSKELKDMLVDKEIEYDSKFSIHPATLKKYCKEQLEKGQNIPDGISHFEWEEAILK